MANTRTFSVDNRTFKVTGLSEDDPYIISVGGRFESRFQDFCRTFLEKDYVALDIGANIGAVSLILSNYLSEGKVYAIEPGKSVFNLLKKNVSDNGVSNIIPYNYAISDTSKPVSFIESSAYGHIDHATLNQQKDLADDNTIMALSLDDLVEKLGIERLDFIKIDIEGFEPQFFAGAIKAIERFNPIIYFELNSWCLIYNGKNDPLKFMQEVTDRFRYIYRVNKDENCAQILENIQSKDCFRTLVHDNIVLYGSVNDIVVSNNREKFNYGSVELATKVDALRSQLNSVSAERDNFRNALSAIISSRSYRYTSFLRTIKKNFHL